MREINLELCLDQFLLLSDKCIDLKKMFCSNMITRPIPNSTADKTKKKNVSDNKLVLSYI
jgi:hypothetical protein